MMMRKVSHDKHFTLKHEGKSWILDCAVWIDRRTGKGEFRVYRIDGDITTPLLAEALELEAQGRALTVVRT